MGVMETFGGSVENVPTAGKALGGMVVGIAAGFSFHESIDSDEQAIILNRGRVKLDRQKLHRDFKTGSVQWARRVMEASKAADKQPERDEAEYARIYNSGGRFKFFSLRSIRKIKTNARTSGLPAQTFDLKRGLWVLDSNVTWKPGSHGQCAARALLRLNSQEEIAQKAVASTALAARESILEMDEENPESLFKQSDVFGKIMERCGEPLERDFGIVLLDYEIATFGPAPAERQRRVIFEGPDGEPIDPRELPRPAIYSVPTTAAGA